MHLRISARLTTPIICPEATTGTRLMFFATSNSAIREIGSSGCTVTTSLLITSLARNPCAFRYIAILSPVRDPASSTSSHHDRRLSSAACRPIKSPSLTIPISLPDSLSTGTALIRLCRRTRAISRTGVPSITYVTGEDMISLALGTEIRDAISDKQLLPKFVPRAK
jgi:hypothetical protein